MRSGLSQRVLAKQTRLNINTRKAVALRCEARYLFIRETGADWQALKRFGFFHLPTEAFAVFLLNIDNFCQLINHRIERAIDFIRRNFQGIRRVVTRQDHAIAINDQAAIRNRRHNRYSIALGALVVLAMTDRL